MVKIIHNKDKLPPLIQSFLAFASIWKKDYNLRLDSSKHSHTIVLKEICHDEKFPRKIIISISQKPISYSIELYEPHTNGDGAKEYRREYCLGVQGDNNLEDIIRETDSILNGKKTFKFKPNFPL